MRRIRSTVAIVLVLGMASACAPPEWTASDHAAVTLACLRGAAIATDQSVGEVLSSDQGEDFQRVCAAIAVDYEEAGCDPEEAAEIAEGLALVGADLSKARMDEC